MRRAGRVALSLSRQAPGSRLRAAARRVDRTFGTPFATHIPALDNKPCFTLRMHARAMQRFLRILNKHGTPTYLNLQRVERIEIQENPTHAVIYLVGKTEPIAVKEEYYSELIDFLGKDQGQLPHEGE